MGAGAGYDVTISNGSIEGDIEVKSFEIEEKNSYDVTVRIKCDVKIEADVHAESYYYGTGDIKDVDLVFTEISMPLGIGNGYNGDILTEDAIERMVEEYRGKENWYSRVAEDIDDLDPDWIASSIDADDIDPLYIQDLIKDIRWSGTAKLGGGWAHSTFTGDIEDLDIENSYDEGVANLYVVEKFVTDYIDKAVTGDNRVYTPRFNGEPLDGFEDSDEAIEYLKDYIDKFIAEGKVDDIDWSDCYVDMEYEILTSGKGDWDFDDYYETVYKAEYDADYDEYVNGEYYEEEE